MKKILILLPLIFLFSGCMSTMMKQFQNTMDKMMGPVKESEMAMEVVDSTTLRTVIDVGENSPAVIKDRLLLWIGENFNQPGDHITYEDNPDSPWISGTGSALVTITAVEVKQPVVFYFKYLFEIKSGRVRFSIIEPRYYLESPVTFGTSAAEPDLMYANEDILKRMSRGIKERDLIGNIASFIDDLQMAEADW